MEREVKFMIRLLLLCSIATCLLADSTSEAPAPLQKSTMISLGAYRQDLSNGYGTRRGSALEGTYDPGKGGPWLASIVDHRWPEGSGTMFTLGKYQTLGEHGYFFLGVGSSRGDDFLPSFRGDFDLNLALGKSGWVAGFGLSRIQVRDGHTDTLVQVGPTLYARGWVTTMRYLRNFSNPGNLQSNSMIVDLRRGTDDRAAWQSLKVAWGGEAYQNLKVFEAVGSRGVSVNLFAFQPLSANFGLKGDLNWGQKNGAYQFWGCSLACVLILK